MTAAAASADASASAHTSGPSPPSAAFSPFHSHRDDAEDYSDNIYAFAHGETSSGDSPPGLTASGSSDDGSSPSSVTDGMKDSSSTSDGGHGGRNADRNGSVSRHTTPALRHPSDAKIYDAATAAFSPTSSSSWIDATSGSSSNGGSIAGETDFDTVGSAADASMSLNMDWASPLHFPGGTDHHFSSPSFHNGGSAFRHHFDNTSEDDGGRRGGDYSSHFSPSSSSTSPSAPPRDAAESKYELRAASDRIMANGGDEMTTASAAPPLAHSTSQEEDEQMFDSIIEQSSFGPASVASSVAHSPTAASSPQQVKPLSSAFGAMHIPSAAVSSNGGGVDADAASRSVKTEAVTPGVEQQQQQQQTHAPPPSYPSTATMMQAMASQWPANAEQHAAQMSMQQHQLPMASNGGPAAMVPSMSSSSSSATSPAQTHDADASRRASMEGQSQAEAGPSNHGNGSAAVQNDGNIAGAEGEITLSSSVIIRPPLDNLPEMEVHVHGIPAEGAKSRVETQIKAHVELVRSHKRKSDEGDGGDAANKNATSSSQEDWERVGSFTHLKLPPLSATKRKTKKNQQNGEIPKEKTLYLDVAVVTASPPHQRAFACSSCSERERKRAERRKSGRAKSGPIPSEEEMRRLGVDPNAADAVQVAQERLIQEESKRIILFNCGDYVEFKDGHAELPTRITCYCRHHKEKLGFCILFTMRNWKGKTVACGSTPAIMITDDHKSSAALEKFRKEASAAAAAAEANGGLPGADMAVDNSHMSHGPRQRTTTSADRSRAGSTETTTGASSSGAAGGASRSSKSSTKRSRAKPYDSSRRSTVSSANGGSGGGGAHSVNGTGASSPTNASQAQQQQQHAPPLDLVQALAAIGSERAMQDAQGNAVGGTMDASQGQQQSQGQSQHMTDNFAAMAFQPPQQQMAPFQQQQGNQGAAAFYQQQQQMPPQFLAQQLMQQQQQQASHLQHHQMLPGMQPPQFPPHHHQQPFANILAEGSISPDTMATNPMSLPQLDFGNNLIAQQMLALLGQQGLLPRGFPAAAGDSTDKSDGSAGGSGSTSTSNPAPPPPPLPTISKIIPGEGPTTGGIEVTILGENFVDGLTCCFGDLAATSTRVWAANTLICVLPPSPSPGPVAVTLKHLQQQQSQQQQAQQQAQQQRPLQLFTYVDKCDTQLMELALQVVGFQQTRTMQVPREIALRLLASGQGSINSNIAAQQQQQNQQQGRNAVEGLFAGSSSSNFQDTIVHFLTSLLGVDNGVIAPRLDAIRLSNRNGHTLLHLAVCLGFHRLVARLLDLGCPLDARDKNGFTALHLAALNGRSTVARILLRHGARTGIKSFAGSLPIDLAAEQDHFDVIALLEARRDVGEAPVHVRRLDNVVEEVEGDDESSIEDDLEAETDWDVHAHSLDATADDADADNISTGVSSLDEDGGDDDDGDETHGGWTDDDDLEYDDDDSSESDSDEDGDGDDENDAEHSRADLMPTPRLSAVNAGGLWTTPSGASTADATPRPPSSPTPTDEKKAVLPSGNAADNDAAVAAPLSSSEEKKLLQERDDREATAASLKELEAAAEAAAGMAPPSKSPSSKLLSSPRSSLRSFASRFGPPGGMTMMNMPATAIAVFQMTMPGGGGAAAAAAEARAKDVQDASLRRDAKADATTPTEEDPSRLTSLWRHLLVGRGAGAGAAATKEGGVVAPPPAYEAVSGDSAETSGAVQQQQPPTTPSASSDAGASTASSGVEAGTEDEGQASDEGEQTPTAAATAAAAKECSSSPAPAATTTVATTASANPAAAAATRRMNYEDDWMLRWFWLPCIFVVLLVAAFSTGPLSLAELGAYVPSVRR